MKDTFNKLETGQLNRRDKDQERGLKASVIFDCIEPEDWMCPVLHAVDLFVNTPFNFMLRWIWERVESVAPELVEARLAYPKAIITKEECWRDVLESEQYSNEMKVELRALDLADDEDLMTRTMKKSSSFRKSSTNKQKRQ